jgi:nucleotide-binding universal stress UspA family protein
MSSTEVTTTEEAGRASGGDTTPPATDVSPDELHSHWRRMMRVLVATDGSASAADAIGFAVDFASARDAEVTFVHVVPTVEFVPTTGGDDFGGALRHEPTAADHALLREAAAVASQHGVTASTTLLGGSTAEAIVAHAESYGADLIVIGSRGHGALSSALLGSVALGVLHTAKQPVIVIKCAMPPHPAGTVASLPEAGA